MAKKKPPLPTSAPLAWPSLADVLRERGLPVADEQAGANGPPLAGTIVGDGAPELSRNRKIVVRRERKGHGGKTVTVIDGLQLSASQLETVARTLRKALGCGSRVDDGRVLLQGDVAPAAETWLRAHGAARVTLGN